MSSLDEHTPTAEILKVHFLCFSYSRAALMRRIFAKFDVDGNGVLNRQELRRATSLLGDHFDEEETGLLMEVLDKDNSDTLDMEEFIQAFMNARRA